MALRWFHGIDVCVPFSSFRGYVESSGLERTVTGHAPGILALSSSCTEPYLRINI